jgi:hypothetical protein
MNPDNSAGRQVVGTVRIPRLGSDDEITKRKRLRIAGGLAPGSYYLVICVDVGNRFREGREGNNCRTAGQVVVIIDIGPGGTAQTPTEIRIQRTNVPIGRATIVGFYHNDASAPGNPRSNTQGFGDDEKSNERRELANTGGVRIVADCKRTTNGDFQAPEVPPAAGTDREYDTDEDGDEAKILIYTDTGTVNFNSVGASSRRNIPPGEGNTESTDPHENGTNNPPPSAGNQDETDGGEGRHMAIAAARDPDPDRPEPDWKFAYKVGTIYITHSNGTELILTAYAGIDILGAQDQCVFGGVLKVVNLG